MKKNLNANTLRTNSTEVEKKLWRKLRNRNFYDLKFRRQYIIDMYIVDFVCIKKNIIIELDGGQHNFAKNITKDKERDEYIQSKGFKISRFWNNEINSNLEGVLETIAREASIED